MKHFMVDLETLGTVPGCVILSIGLVGFDPHAEDPEDILAKDGGMYCVVSKQDCLDNLLHVDPDTEAWWAKREAAAKQVLFDAENPDIAIPLKAALNKMYDYTAEHCNRKDVLLYGNGADFDNPILRVAAHCVGEEQRWGSPGRGFFGGRCYRTLKNLRPDMKPRRIGVHHNALDDAKTQAVHLAEICHNTNLVLQ